MNETYTRRLLSTYPMLFRNQHESAMQRGFECGDGWFDLVYQLARDIEIAARERGLEPNDQSWPLCRQVKEKHGSLRFVVFAVEGQPELSARINELKHQAMARSLHICAQCGELRACAQLTPATEQVKSREKLCQSCKL